MKRIFFATILLVAPHLALAQSPAPQPSRDPNARIDSPSELDKLKDSCTDFSKFMDCAEELFTGKPIHIAVGSIAPQNGFGSGVAYLGHKTTDNWRTSWDADAVGSINGSWRAGVYLKLVHTPDKGIGVSFGTPPPLNKNLTELPEHSVINIYAQSITLNKLTFFGLGPNSTAAGRSFYGMRETILGVSAVKPAYERLHLSFYGEMNGRFVNIRPSLNQPSPSIGLLYDDATAPGLSNQPAYFQLGEGIRIRPDLFNDSLRLNYDLSYKQFLSPGNSNFTFERLTADLSHQIPIYKKTTRWLLPRDSNGPDDCSLAPASGHSECPQITRDLEGSINFRFFLSTSMTPGGTLVPFYFQPTLGGSNIDGDQSLSSYQDFRFRAPNVMLFRQSFEHSLGKLPLGLAFMVDEAKLALTRSDLGSNPWLHTYSAGLTLRAGGFPQVFLLFSWGGSEGTHLIANVNNSLLGASARPSLF
ncbi:MAG TPA: hypothetical protein VJN93_02230 [Candidatus Acidoferrum sp.]|nr:hypothetical protein [Candidatus Acidoferrum sp.]